MEGEEDTGRKPGATEKIMARMLAISGVMILAGAAFGQEQTEPRARPAPKPIAPEKRPAPPVKDDSIPGLEDSDFRIKPAPLRREGSFIIRQRGSLARLPGGERAMVFHKDAKGKAERPMVLLPCLTLQSMEQVASDAETVFMVSGQVYVYHGVNYLLPTAAPVAPAASAAPVETKAEGGAEPEKGSEPPKTGEVKPSDPAVDQLIRDLELQKDRPRTLGNVPKEVGAGGTGAVQTDLLPENSIISLKRGRLVRMNGGEWGFASDNSTAGEASADRALVLSPCLNLQRLEQWASKMGEGASVLISGRVFQYQGRNHVMVTMHQVAGTGELSPRQ